MRVWGRVVHLGPTEFVALATGVSERALDLVEVELREFTCLCDAQVGLRQLMIEMGENLRSKGHKIVDVEGE